MSEEQQYDFVPMEIYHTVPISAGQSHFTFDFIPKTPPNDAELLYDKTESEITLRFISDCFACTNFLIDIGINPRNCWIFHEILVRKLIKDFRYDKPGDIDLIVGNFKPDGKTPDFDYIVGIQIKLRKVTANGSVKSFSSGRGTKQTFHTAKLGFNKTFLFHFFVRDPSPVPEGYAKSWNPFHNTNFVNAIKASTNSVLTGLNKEVFGYGYTGWGQPYGGSSFELGGFSRDILVDAPFNPYLNNSEVQEYRMEMIQSLERYIFEKYSERKPLIVKV